MQSEYEKLSSVYEQVGEDPNVFSDEDVAHLMIQENRVIGGHLVPGLEVNTQELEDGVAVKIYVAPGSVIERPVQMCFGVLPEEGVQRIELDVEIGEESAIDVLAHCAFPNAVKVEHVMNAEIRLRQGATGSTGIRYN